MVSDKEATLFTRYIPDRRGRVAIDAGCGNGKFSRQLRAFGYHVTGFDFSTVSLKAAQRSGFGLGLAYLRHDLDSGDPPACPLTASTWSCAVRSCRCSRSPRDG
ncbi:class I SAM-dependent methyltransferase [Streptomyces sp. 7N604]|uniref:class I SAM-dependent methyltransferase n=1 Tax=Streptomyces sp. 7N604 TaxID=3457415 RepID=UPI003FD0589E